MTEQLAAPGVAASDVLGALSVGTRDQLATLLRLALARHPKAPLLLDDHLVHTDPARLGWFRRALLAAATGMQVVVLTCRPEDYLAPDGTADGIHAIDVGRAIHRR